MKDKIVKKKITLETIADSIGRLDIGLKKLDIKIDEKIDSLAMATAKGFESVDKRFNELDKKVDHVERTLSGKIDRVDRRIDDLAINRATKKEFYEFTQRVVKIETNAGIRG